MSGDDRTAWIGRPLQRLEDDALLRGAGRFLDDLHPVAHAGHAAGHLDQLAHQLVWIVRERFDLLGGQLGRERVVRV